MSNSYQVSNGQIIDPNAQVFVARGIDVMEGNQPSAALLQQDFPGINFVRLAIYDYASPTALTSYVNDLTSHGIVVELEDHANSNGSNAGGSQGQIFTGQELTNESNWYSSIASAFKDNPLVWFGTDNEPSEYDASGTFNPTALSDWQLQTYNAIRNAGNTSPVMLEANGWSSNGAPVMLQGYNASDYAGMKNVVWDPHYYGWLTNYSTDQTTNNNFIAQLIQQVQQITSADGKIPVIFGEYGNSTTGLSIDANGNQVIQAVLNSGVGNVAWAWGTGNPGDGLTNADNTLSAYGKLVAAGIAAQAAKAPTTPAPTPTPTPVPVATPSANDTVVMAGSSAVITDVSGNSWTITSGGQVAVKGTADATTANVAELAYVNGTVWQENTNNLWWSKTSPTAAWGPATGTSTSPLPATIKVIASSTTVSQSQVSAMVTSGAHMLFISGSNDIVDLAGGTTTVTDTGSNNTYILPAAGKGTVTFSGNILATSDTLDLKAALAATNWIGASSTLSKYLTVIDTARGAKLSISSTSGGMGVAIATINGATTTNLTSLLAHAIT